MNKPFKVSDKLCNLDDLIKLISETRHDRGRCEVHRAEPLDISFSYNNNKINFEFSRSSHTDNIYSCLVQIGIWKYAWVMNTNEYLRFKHKLCKLEMIISLEWIFSDTKVPGNPVVAATNLIQPPIDNWKDIENE